MVSRWYGVYRLITSFKCVVDLSNTNSYLYSIGLNSNDVAACGQRWKFTAPVAWTLTEYWGVGMFSGSEGRNGVLGQSSIEQQQLHLKVKWSQSMNGLTFIREVNVCECVPTGFVSGICLSFGSLVIASLIFIKLLIAVVETDVVLFNARG